MLKLRSLAIALLLAPLLSCSSQMGGYESLANQGMLPLSTNNPYLGSNLFLATEAEQSSFLYNFLKGRGAPTAVEVLESRIGPVRIIMFYPSEKEVYIADLDRRKGSRQWITRGPFQIDRKDYRELVDLEHSMVGEPIFIIHGKQHRFRFQEQEVKRVLSPKVPPTPIPTPKPKVITVKPKVKPEDAVPTDFSKMNTDQMALYVAKGFAERSVNGDLIHTVKYENVTLEAIAKWYTGSAENVEKIAAANGLTKESTLAKGQRIRIAAELVKEPKQLPAGFK